ncbi:MAG: hypothetical protein PWQ67_779 [Clostridia bacterium]|jgi:hypothetical protein|nr:hypothetical protein [Clostridia bacterium]MDN5322325.1 hypothetical protein [Clostridia bacterium]
MPGFNGMGPFNEGAMTGRGRGYCIRVLEPGQAAWFGMGRRGAGRGIGRGLGPRTGRGIRCWGPVSVDPNFQKTLLKEKKEYLKQELSRIEQLIEDEQDSYDE